MASVNQTWPHCVNQMGKTHYKPLAARHGRGTAWARHAICESAFTVRVVIFGVHTEHREVSNRLNIFIYEYEAKPKQLRADEERLRKIRQI